MSDSKQSATSAGSANHGNYSFNASSKTSYKDNGHVRSFKCVIVGTPRPMDRPRFVTNKITGKKHVYSPSGPNVNSFKKAFQEALATCNAAEKFAKGGKLPVKLVLRFFYARPKSHYDFVGQLSSGAPIYATDKADIDNLTKLVMDACQHVCFGNDITVAHVDAAKLYDPHTKWYSKDSKGHTVIGLEQVYTTEKVADCKCMQCKYK